MTFLLYFVCRNCIYNNSASPNVLFQYTNIATTDSIIYSVLSKNKDLDTTLQIQLYACNSVIYKAPY